MPTMTASEARHRLFPLLAQVNDDHAPVRITSRAGNAVLMSEEEYEALQTTRYLFSTCANATHLLDSLAQADRGEFAEHTLDRA
jgi:antitoxin YefM